MRYQWIQKSRRSSSSEHLPTWLSVVSFNSDTLQSQEVIIIIAEFFRALTTCQTMSHLIRQQPYKIDAISFL